MPEARAAARQAAESRAQVGCARLTCATQPVPKKLLSRFTVRSMNWSTSTKSPGAMSSRNDPTAETETTSVVVSEQGPQQPQLGWGFNQGSTKPSPAGGTPEPGMLLLLSGGGLAYGALRRRKKNVEAE